MVCHAINLRSLASQYLSWSYFLYSISVSDVLKLLESAKKVSVFATYHNNPWQKQ